MSLDDLQAQLRGALDQQFAALKQRYEQEIAEARRAAEAESERRIATELEAARAEWERQLQTIVDATRAEAQRQAAEASAAEREALRQQFEQQTDERVTHAVAAARRGAELELESERRRTQHEIERVQKESEGERARAAGELEAERQRAKSELDALRLQMQSEIAGARASAAEAAKAAAAAAAPKAAPAADAAFAQGIRTIDAGKTLSQTLEALLQHSAAVAGRAALFLINGDRLKAWKTSGIPDVDVQTVESSIGGRDLLARAIQAGTATLSAASLPAPPFARLPLDRLAVAVPLMIGGRPVAVLYADTGESAAPPGGWSDAVEVLVRHASTIAALRTATRTLDVLGGRAGTAGEDAPGHGNGEESARRYAKLLVSEIKLYNEPAVRAGREQRDLLTRLRSEIDRAQRLYEERVPPAVAAREQYFRQELVQTLADGDPSLLGN